MKKIILILTVMAITINALAQKDKNPFGLVYDNAIVKNEKGKVNIHPVTYKAQDITVSANVYTPANYDKNKKYPAIVVAHPNGGVKEQVAGAYAQILAQHGFITIAADARYQGASSGEPRNLDRPSNRIEDIFLMVDYISQYPGVDKTKIGAFGICGGGGYTLGAAQADKRIKAVAVLSMFNSGDVRRNGYMRSQMNTIQERLQQASQARADEADGKPVQYLGGMNMTKEQAEKVPVDLYREGYFYYGVDYSHPNATGTYTASSMMELMNWDATDRMNLIAQPLLIIAGSKADSKYMSDEAFEKATGTLDKEYFIIDGATHIQTYFVKDYVKQVENKLNDFFSSKLGQ